MSPSTTFICAMLLFLTLTQLAFADDHSDQSHTFPVMKVTDLNGRSLTLPADFESDFNLCLIAFDRDQQKNVMTWVNGTQSIIGPSGVSFYEFPTISKLPGFIRSYINSGMRRGIPDRSDRAHTITLYIDKEPFKQSLGLGTEKLVYAVLVDKKGSVIWHASGDYTDEAGQSLRQSIDELRKLSKST